jgi:hypothetical protein
VGDKLPTRIIGTQHRELRHGVALLHLHDWSGMHRRTDLNLEELGFTKDMAGKEQDGEWEKIDPEQTDGAYIGPSRGHLFPRWAHYHRHVARLRVRRLDGRLDPRLSRRLGG